MSIHVVEESAATSSGSAQNSHETAAATGMSEQSAKLLTRTSRPGPLMAALMGSALTYSGVMIPVVTYTGRKRDDILTESGTTRIECDPELVDQIRELFEQGASEFFHDGIESAFSKSLLGMVAHHGRAALYAIADYLFSGERNPDVVSEALRWLADVKDPATFGQRWSILQQTMRHRSPRVRDGSILGFAALDDPRARPLLVEARNAEQVAELRRLIDQVIQQLDTTHAPAPPNRAGEPLV